MHSVDVSLYVNVWCMRAFVCECMVRVCVCMRMHGACMRLYVNVWCVCVFVCECMVRVCVCV